MCGFYFVSHASIYILNFLQYLCVPFVIRRAYTENIILVSGCCLYLGAERHIGKHT